MAFKISPCGRNDKKDGFSFRHQLSYLCVVAKSSIKILTGVSAIKIFRSNIITLALAICFCVASYFFLTAYNRYDISREKVEVMTKRVGLLKQQKREAQRKWRILTRVNSFVDRASSLGLEGKKWANYDVNIQEPVTFFEMEQILNQCLNSSSYYFRPIALHANISPESDAKIVKKASTSADSRESKKGDLMLTLRGAFIVRE